MINLNSTKAKAVAAMIAYALAWIVLITAGTLIISSIIISII